MQTGLIRVWVLEEDMQSMRSKAATWGRVNDLVTTSLRWEPRKVAVFLVLLDNRYLCVSWLCQTIGASACCAFSAQPNDTWCQPPPSTLSQCFAFFCVCVVFQWEAFINELEEEQATSIFIVCFVMVAALETNLKLFWNVLFCFKVSYTFDCELATHCSKQSS